MSEHWHIHHVLFIVSLEIVRERAFSFLYQFANRSLLNFQAIALCGSYAVLALSKASRVRNSGYVRGDGMVMLLTKESFVDAFSALKRCVNTQLIVYLIEINSCKNPIFPH